MDKSRFNIVDAEFAHLEELYINIRQSDLLEIEATTETPPFDALSKTLKDSREKYTFMVDGKVMAIGGVCPVSLAGGNGVIWLIGTDLVDEYAREFLVMSKWTLGTVLHKYVDLYNWVDARNTKSIKWLKWLGFKIHSAKPFGVYGLPFHKFERVK